MSDSFLQTIKFFFLFSLHMAHARCMNNNSIVFMQWELAEKKKKTFSASGTIRMFSLYEKEKKPYFSLPTFLLTNGFSAFYRVMFE